MASKHRAGEAKVTLARIVRPRGVKGEVAAQILTDFPERLTKLREVWLSPPGNSPDQDRRVRVRRCWLATSHGGQAIFHFEGCGSIDQAKPLVGCEIQVPMAERAPLPRGKHYVNDLIGCEVFERQRAAPRLDPLGIIRNVNFTGGSAPLLVVDGPAGEILIPFADEICVVIDPARRRIEVVLPEGLRDLNR